MREKRIVCVTQYLVSHLVGPHGHLFDSHVFHVAAVLFGGSPRGTELDVLRPGRGPDFKRSLTTVINYHKALWLKQILALL